MSAMESFLYDLEIVDDFVAEATEHLDTVADLALEAEQGSGAACVDLQRELHTLKGAAGFLGLDEFSELCHELEELLLRDAGAAPPLNERFDLVHEVCDVLRAWVREAERCCRQRDTFRPGSRGARTLARLRQASAA